MILYRSLLPVICGILFIFTSCSDDYIESGIEGRWQLRQVLSPDGQATSVDTVFYSFRKKVFEYRMLPVPAQYAGCYGMYDLDGDKLEITIDAGSFFPDDCDSCIDWDEPNRTYRVIERTSSKMELEYAGFIFSFRKY